MEKSHLVHILRTLEKKEIRDLKKWVASPAHNLRQDVVELLEYLMSGKHLHDAASLGKEKVFSVLYPGRTFSDAEMRQAIHFLLKAVEDFLVFHENLKDEVRTKAVLARVYRQRQLPKLFQKTMDTGQEMQKKQPFRNHHFLENEYAFQFEQYNYLAGLGRSVPYNLQEVSDSSDLLFMANKLKISCLMVAHQAVFKSDYRMKFLDGVLEYIKGNEHTLNFPAIGIYYYGYKALTNQEQEEYYQKLKEQIVTSSDLFPQEEIRVIYLMAINYCINRINAGKAPFWKEAFEMYNHGLKRQTFLENGILSRFTFMNAITTALKLHEYGWVESFIHEFSPFLEEKHRENFVKFHLARLYFEKKNYDKAMKFLAQSDYSDLLMSLNAKTMLLKMYYELEEYTALDSLLESMRTYLQRKKVMGYHKVLYSNFVNLTRKLAKLSPFDSEGQKKLGNEVRNADPLSTSERQWLLEQLDKIS